MAHTINKTKSTKVSIGRVRITTDHVRCLLTNASIDRPEYSSPEFRLRNIQEAMAALAHLERDLVVDIALANMRK